MSDCAKCHGTGWWRYDAWHTQPCPTCCSHADGVWFLTFEYDGAGKWCCQSGCGTTWAGIVDYQKRFG